MYIEWKVEYDQAINCITFPVADIGEHTWLLNAFLKLSLIFFVFVNEEENEKFMNINEAMSTSSKAA